jgi:sulfonate transport system permease protein
MPRRARWALLGGAILPATVLIVWGVASALDATSPARPPSPSDVISAAGELIGGGIVVPHLVVSLGRLLTGFAFGSTAGLVVAVVMRRWRLAAVMLKPTLNGLRTLPSFAWLPLALIPLGVGEGAIVIVIAIGAFFPLASGAEIAPGLRQALGQSWLVMIAAELLSSSRGIGYLLIESSGQNRTDRALVVIAVLAVLIKGSDLLVARLERRVPDTGT